MAIRLDWSNAARADLLDIYLGIAVEQPMAADRWLDRIVAKARLLTVQPRIGARRSDIRPSMRMLVEAPYLILYRTDPDTDEGPLRAVEIIRVVSGRRDLAALF
ncbi:MULTISPECIES: type II toxin-antitoxin system RelE/ParE family toxin [Rhodopseudomonas]|uniref:Plasmid stabilization protein n=1 Tax=Rhodopseudomonas palustris TaxID=1076 RepID=A0A0D7EPY0_RHOPL|nr:MULTISPECIES: type II toxin-antitoxin system RelE/ParE family toxin [Rhodopseudomonas]KIZ42701.1 plasmid stabilization protein [Rhodopseudomonas palustris]MDF3811833.1 type II toxin-antitoxin system RelE/ParE family toxin [Rhodopseudomonas sp. BAL398]WOK20300.1 type II toxin-antitoxin system RelE/ParE family toxin [Rhodopseudomonas sp. BAL398]